VDQLAPNNRTLSIVVPLYNEEETLAYTHQRLARLCLSEKLSDICKIEIIYVDDGSEDSSPEILKAIINSNTPALEARHIRFSRNFGHSAAVFAGLEFAKGDVIAIIDADLQDPPELIPLMYEQLCKGADVIYGQRITRESETPIKRLTAWLFYRVLALLTGVNIPKDTGDFRIMVREVAEAVLSCKEHEPFLRGLVAWVGYRQRAFQYTREGRKYGTTKYPFKKMFRFAALALVSFSSLPLRLALYTGALGLILSLVFFLWAIFERVHGQTVPGWASLFVAFTFGHSMTLMLVGIVGIYIGRLHTETQGRPRYIVRRSRG